MNINEIVIGDRVLVQVRRGIKELAQVIGIDTDASVIVKNTFGDINAYDAEFIIKSFGQL